MLVDTMKEKNSNFIGYKGSVYSVAMFRLTRVECYRIKPVWSFREK